MSYELLYREHLGAVTSYVGRRAGAVDVDDAVAETFLIAWRRLNDVPEGNARAWLYGVARRVLAGQRRAYMRRDRLRARLNAAVPMAVASDATGGVGEMVLEALARLGTQDRVVLHLAVINGLPARDIAALLSCSPNAAALRVHRAKQRLVVKFAAVLREKRTPLPRPT